MCLQVVNKRSLCLWYPIICSPVCPRYTIKEFIRHSSEFFKVQLSQPYDATGQTKDNKSRTFVGIAIDQPRLCHNVFYPVIFCFS